MHLKQQYMLFSLICNVSVCLSGAIYFLFIFMSYKSTQKRVRLVHICLWCCVLFQWLLA